MSAGCCETEQLQPGLSVKVHQVNSILIIHSCGIGDLLMFTPALRILHDAYPEASIDFLIGEDALIDIVDRFSFVSDIFQYESGWNYYLLKSMRKKHYDLSILTADKNPVKASVLMRVIGAQRRAGNYLRYKQPLLTDQTEIDVNIHRVEQNLKLVSAILGTPIDDMEKAVALPVYPEELADARQMLEDKDVLRAPLIAVHAGGHPSNMQKRWPVEHLTELLSIIADNVKCHFLIFGTDAEQDECAYICRTLANRAIPIMGVSLGKVLSLLRYCKIYIGNDSGVGHMAASQGVPTLTVFGPTNPVRTRPYISPHLIVSAASDTDSLHVKEPDSRESMYLRDLSADTVFQMLKTSALYQYLESD